MRQRARWPPPPNRTQPPLEIRFDYRSPVVPTDGALPEFLTRRGGLARR
jgi:hypothetical protein